MQGVTLHRTTTRGLLVALDKLKKLSPQQRNLLTIVASRRGAIVPRETIINEMYDFPEDGGPLTADHAIRVRASQLRKAGFAIKAHWGRGFSYVLDWSVAPVKAKRAA